MGKSTRGFTSKCHAPCLCSLESRMVEERVRLRCCFSVRRVYDKKAEERKRERGRGKEFLFVIGKGTCFVRVVLVLICIALFPF